MIVRAVDTLEKAEELRLLRNECAEWMTKDTRQISPQEQRVFFWEKIATGAIEGFLIYSDGEPVAYGLLVWDSKVFGRVWSSTGVKTEKRGRGLGREAMTEVVRRAHAEGVPMWAEVRRDNLPQQKLCYSIGYYLVETFERNGHVIDVLRCDKIQETP